MMATISPTAFVPFLPLFHHAHHSTLHGYRPRSHALPPRRAAHPPPTATATNPQIETIDPTSTDALITTLEPYLTTLETPPSTILSQIIRHLADPRGMARLALVEALGMIGQPAIPYLLDSLSSHPNPVVRRSSGKALAKIPHPSALPALLHALVHDPDTVTRSSAAGALAKMGPHAIPQLIELLSSDVSSTAKGHAAWAMAFMQDASGALLDAVRHPSVDVRVAVVSALGALAIGDALPAMGAGAEDDWGTADLDVRDRAVGALHEALGDADPGVRAEAATALANAGCVEEADRVASMLKDPDVELRRCAALALMKLGDTRFVTLLREREDDHGEDDGVRSVCRLAADSLERMVLEDDDWV